MIPSPDIFLVKVMQIMRYLYTKIKVKWTTAVEGDPEASFLLATVTRAGEGITPFPDFTPSMLVLILPTLEGWKAE